MSERIYNVLLPCAGNRAQSIPAESILRQDARQNFRTDGAISGREKAS
jgi:hypothetical protein